MYVVSVAEWIEAHALRADGSPIDLLPYQRDWLQRIRQDPERWGRVFIALPPPSGWRQVVAFLEYRDQIAGQPDDWPPSPADAE